MGGRMRVVLAAVLLACTVGWPLADPPALVVPRRTWLEDAWDREEAAYAAVAIPGDGVVVVGTAGVLRYSLQGDPLWTAGYPGIGYGVARDPNGTIAVAGSGGLITLTPTGTSLWRLEGGFVDVAFGPEGTLWALGESGLWNVSAGGAVLSLLPYPGTAKAVAVAAGRAVVGGSAGAVNFDLGAGRPSWTASYPGRIEDVALDERGGLFIVGSAGVHAYDSRGVFLWEREFPGEARAVSTFKLREDELWILVGGTAHHLGRARIRVVALTPDGEVVWESIEGIPDEECFGYGLASDPVGNCFYAVGAVRRLALEAPPSCYRTLQYAPAALTAVGCRGPSAHFAGPHRAVVAGEKVSFQNLSHSAGGHLVAWLWDFGDGRGSRAWLPTHIYDRPGTYVVTLTVFDDQLCSSTASAVVEVEARPPRVLTVLVDSSLRADFTWTVDPEVYGSYPEGFIPDGPTVLDHVEFVDRSGGGPVTLRAKAASPDGAIVRYQWDLTFDGRFDAEGEEITWSFGEPGVYPATLVVTCEHGKSAVHEFFVDTTEFRPVRWSWTFGDGTRSDLQHPGHRYRRWGTYEVALTVYDARDNSDTAWQSVPVVNVPPVSRFAWEAEAGEGELEAAFAWTVAREIRGSYPPGFDPGDSPTALDVIQFEDLSTGGALTNVVRFASHAWDADGQVVGWSWEFGDGAASEEPNPTHTYAEAGSYAVRLTVVDDAGDTAVYTAVVDVRAGAGAITAWRWEFGDGATSDRRHPNHSYDRAAVYGVSLTVSDNWNNSDMAEDWITVVNVPPVAVFTWSLEPPELPSCWAVFGSCEGGETSGCFCADPVMPENTGTLRLDGTASRDGEPWLDLVSWEWQVVPNGLGVVECEDCESLEPVYRLTAGEGAYYRGDVEVTLRVWDEAGEGGDDYPFSFAWGLLTLDNIPPYAGFRWSLWDAWTQLNCPACVDAFGEGDRYAEVTVGTVTVSRWVSASECMDAVLPPWGGAWVELLIQGTGSETVTLTETVPAGWSYYLESWWVPPCVTVILGEGYFILEMDLAECGGSALIFYELTPPGGPVDPGRYPVVGTVGVVDGEFEGTGELESDLVLCATANVLAYLDLFGNAWDSNGDDIVAWEWLLEGGGVSWESSDPQFWAVLELEALICFWDEEQGEWFWSFDLDRASLTVTDSGGASTTVEGRIPLRGRVSWGGE